MSCRCAPKQYPPQKFPAPIQDGRREPSLLLAERPLPVVPLGLRLPQQDTHEAYQPLTYDPRVPTEAYQPLGLRLPQDAPADSPYGEVFLAQQDAYGTPEYAQWDQAQYEAPMYISEVNTQDAYGTLEGNLYDAGAGVPEVSPEVYVGGTERLRRHGEYLLRGGAIAARARG